MKSTDTQKERIVLQPACPYSQELFSTGLIPLNAKDKTSKKTSKETEEGTEEGTGEGEKLALTYLPLPQDLSKDLSLRALFRYDISFKPLRHFRPPVKPSVKPSVKPPVKGN